MTKKEAKEVLYRTEQFGVYDQTHEAVETVFKALEQSVSLDRIKVARDEIENLDGTTDDYTCGTEVVFRNMVDAKEVLSILDKLIAEVEETK